jgi:hypothetical protein
MIRILLSVAVLGSVGSFAGLAMAQGKPGETSGSDVSSLVAKLEAQCAHRRRTMPPDPGDECARKLRDAQLATGVTGAANGGGQAGGAGIGIGAGPGGGAGNGIGPGGNGGGLAKGRK